MRSHPNQLWGGDGAGGGGGGDRGRGGAAAFHNGVLINWKELADNPRLKGNFGDMKNKTIQCDLEIYKKRRGSRVVARHQ